ncbi:MAG: Omp28-related outer membrane protein [Crocinitomicaceae bacterium]|nr:Omp28-related outer membrane protein [Crocinitomicaceae bacterium]
MKKQILFFASLFLASQSFSQVISSEDFNSGLPATWTQQTSATDGGWKNGTATALSSSSFSIPEYNGTKIMATNDDGCNCNKSSDRLISPSIDLSSETGYVRLSVDYLFAKGSYQGATEDGTIEISTDGGTSWTVLKTLTSQSSFAWRSEMVDLSSYVGQSDVKISFLYKDNGGWLFGYAIDNFKVDKPQADDAQLISASINRFSLTNTNNNLSIKVKNDGSNPITSLDIEWNDGTAHAATINANIAVGAVATITHTTPVNYSTAKTENIVVTITQVNGNVDPVMSNNNGSTIFTTISQSPEKFPVIEEGTGTWCGWCPRGAVAMDYMYENYPDFIGIAVHNGDPMTVSAYDAASDFGGYPSSHVDRALKDQDVSNSDFSTNYNARKNTKTPGSISGTFSSNGSAVQINASAVIYTNSATEDYRMGVIIIEDNVTGTGSGYNQSNYYAGGNYGAMGGFESLPGTVPAAQMVYNHVGRALLGGYNGQTGSIPAPVVDGQAVNYTFNYNVPSTSNKNNMSAVVLLIDNTTKEILNAAKFSLATAGVTEIKTIGLEAFPNPASDKLNVTFEAQGGDYMIQLTDLQGRVVLSKTHSNLNGSQLIEINTNQLNAGNYLLTVAQNGASYAKMISIK